MTVVYLVKNAQSEEYSGKQIWEGSITVEDGEISGPIMLPDDAGAREYWQTTLIPGAGSGYFQYSTSPRDTIKSSGGNWVTWANGTVSSNQAASLTPVNAVRIVSVSGQITGEVLVL